MLRTAILSLGLATLAGACLGPEPTDDRLDDGPGGGKADSGWIADDSYEVGGIVRGSVTRSADGDWADLATSEALQISLVDTQVKFAKNALAAKGWHLDQLTDGVKIVRVDDADGNVTLTYEATIDMIHAFDGTLPKLETLNPRRFALELPVDPTTLLAQAGQRCANNVEAEGDVKEYNYYYYFDASEAGCNVVRTTANLEITQVFERRTAYPEFDQLLAAHGDGSFGFKVALVPDEGDTDARSRYQAHADMLEHDLKLTGVADTANHRKRYEYVRGDVKIIIDLYDPVGTFLTTAFRAALGQYQFVLFNGHSIYGTRDLLTDPTSYSRGYQIIMMHSCRSYPYYARQVFRAKATASDPRGWNAADVIASGESSYPTDSPRTLRVALRGLMDGISAVKTGKPDAAPSWQAIIHGMNEITSGILYGAAGVRENRWQPVLE